MAGSGPQVQNLHAIPAELLPQRNILTDGSDAIRVKKAHEQETLAVSAPHDAQLGPQLKIIHWRLRFGKNLSLGHAAKAKATVDPGAMPVVPRVTLGI